MTQGFFEPIAPTFDANGELVALEGRKCSVALVRMRDDHVHLEIRKGSQTVVIYFDSTAGILMTHTNQRDNGVVRYADDMRKARASGATLQALGERYGVTGERIRQIATLKRTRAPNATPDLIEAVREMWGTENDAGAPLFRAREIGEALGLSAVRVYKLAGYHQFRKRVNGFGEPMWAVEEI